MLYRFLKLIMTLTLRLYFGKIKTQNLSAVNNRQPTLLLANHTNTFMDALLAAVVLQRQIHFFARGDFFKNKLADKLLRSLGMMPVYRISEGKENLERNDATNAEAIDILRKNGAVLIFAEGSSDVAKWVRPLKKGPFRLAVIAANELQRPIQIALLGINYLAPAVPLTDVFIEGAAGPVALPAADETAVSRQRLLLLREASAKLEGVAWHAGSAVRAAIAEGLLLHEKRTLTITRAQLLMTAVRETDEAGLQMLQQSIALPSVSHRAGRAYPLLICILLAVPAFAGLLWHLVPVFAANSITLKKIKEQDFIAPVRAVLSLILVVLWYLLSAVLLLCVWPWYWAVAVLPLTALCGIAALKGFWPAWRKLS